MHIKTETKEVQGKKQKRVKINSCNNYYKTLKKILPNYYSEKSVNGDNFL